MRSSLRLWDDSTSPPAKSLRRLRQFGGAGRAKAATAYAAPSFVTLAKYARSHHHLPTKQLKLNVLLLVGTAPCRASGLIRPGHNFKFKSLKTWCNFQMPRLSRTTFKPHKAARILLSFCISFPSRCVRHIGASFGDNKTDENKARTSIDPK